MGKRSSATSKPTELTIKPQRMGFEFEDSVPRYWFDDDPVVTHFLNALSICFPDGERFFVDSVRAYRDRIPDEERQKDITGFMGQETMHGMEHTTFNRFLAERGYERITDEALATTRMLLKGARVRFTPREMLATTAALEHVTAVLASTILSDPSVVAAMHPDVRPLWVWHSIEEIEHKSVAFDLYRDIDGRQLQRKMLLVLGTLYLAGYSALYTSKLLAHDRAHLKPLTVARGLWRLFGVNGLVTRAVPGYLDFFRDDFHPWQHANEALVSQWRAELDQGAPASA
ncbi:MAG: metal-dependent hydrolase, partial [Polyangiaceae bacterium]|nr:metal-dependent hydrolase [Polyangiaceae bacterium]